MAINNLLGNISEFKDGENWDDYIERFDQFCIANRLEGSDTVKRKLALFLSCVGSQTYSLIKILSAPEKPTTKSYNELCILIKVHLSHESITIAERLKFYNCKQGEMQTLEQFLTQLMELAKPCNFGAFLNTVLCDMFVSGLHEQSVRNVLLTRKNLELRKAFEYASTYEVASKDWDKEDGCNEYSSNDNSSRKISKTLTILCKGGNSRVQEEHESSFSESVGQPDADLEDEQLPTLSNSLNEEKQAGINEEVKLSNGAIGRGTIHQDDLEKSSEFPVQRIITSMHGPETGLPYSCSECGKGFSVLNYLNIHMMTHTSEKPHVCPVCSKRFPDMAQTHMSEDASEKPYMCWVCHKGFHQSTPITSHMENKHHGLNLHTCSECDEEFSLLSSLKTHMVYHRKKKRNVCSECGKPCRTFASLKIHMRIHTGEKPYICSDCGKKLNSNQSLQVHMMKHSGKKHDNCSYCGNGYNTQSHLKSHIEKPTRQKTHNCCQCQQEFNTLGRLKIHMETHIRKVPDAFYNCNDTGTRDTYSSLDSMLSDKHLEDTDLNINGEVKEAFSHEIPSKQSEDDDHSGESCLPFNDDLDQEMSTIPVAQNITDMGKLSSIDEVEIKNGQPLEQGTLLLPGGSVENRPNMPLQTPIHSRRGTHANSKKIKLKNHMMIQTVKKSYVCWVCGEGFFHVTALRTHMRKHPGSKPYKCSDCNEEFTKFCWLKKHKKIHPQNSDNLNNYTRPHICPVCNKGFLTKQNLKCHMMIHTGEKPHVCSYCGKGFTQLITLINHIRTHTGEKPYACPHCDKHFAVPFSFKKHIRTHTEEKTHMCSDCGKTFKELSYLKNHMKSHSGEKPHACSLCNKAFNEIRYLKRHMRTHTGEKPYACSECNDRFSRQDHLKSHMRTHTGEKPHSCSSCSMAYSDVRNLVNHMKTHPELNC